MSEIMNALLSNTPFVVGLLVLYIVLNKQIQGLDKAISLLMQSVGRLSEESRSIKGEMSQMKGEISKLNHRLDLYIAEKSSNAK